MFKEFAVMTKTCSDELFLFVYFVLVNALASVPSAKKVDVKYSTTLR